MAMKAKPVHGHANTCSREIATDDGGVPHAAPEDELVIVLFPRASWDAVGELARDMGVEPAEAMGAALKLLRARVDAER